MGPTLRALSLLDCRWRAQESTLTERKLTKTHRQQGARLSRSMSESAERTRPGKITLALVGALAMALTLALAVGRHASPAGAASPAPSSTYDPALVAKGA